MNKKTESSFGPKNNIEEGKPQLSLLPFDVLELDARTYEYGCEKYYRYSWMKGFRTSNLISATLRHVKAYYWDGKTYDKEALKKGHKLHHLAMARFCLASIIHAELEGLGEDDRPSNFSEGFKKDTNVKNSRFIFCPRCGIKFEGDEFDKVTEKLFINVCLKCRYTWTKD